MFLLSFNVYQYRALNIGFRYFHRTTIKTKSFLNKYARLLPPRTSNTPPYGHVTQVGDPVLRNKAAAVPDDMINCKEIEYLIDNMIQVMRRFNCVGLAAPQIGISLRIIIMEFNEDMQRKFSKEIVTTRKMSLLPLTVMINPTLKITDYSKHKFTEGCTSVTGYAAEVERYDGIVLNGIGKRDTPNELQLNGWNARIAQHEMDHLGGKLFTDIMDPLTFHCTCWDDINREAGRVEISFYK